LFARLSCSVLMLDFAFCRLLNVRVNMRAHMPLHVNHSGVTMNCVG
jgi:hypothetical protein